MKQNNIRISGNIPRQVLYRFFGKERYADEFAHGQIRLGWAKKYCNLENDVRGDETEGTAAYTAIDPNQITLHRDQNTHQTIHQTKGPGLSRVKAVSGNEFYLLCTRAPPDQAEVERLRFEFADRDCKEQLPCYVKIHDVSRFTEWVVSALAGSSYADLIIDVPWFEVEYSKGQPRPNLAPELDLAVYQKPPGLRRQKEWRLAARIRNSGILRTRYNSQMSVRQVPGDDERKRIAACNDLTLNELNSRPEWYDRLKYGVPLWNDTLVVDCEAGLKDCLTICR